ncbi:hypothetical protein BBO99_00000865 [Phytophthora kernoviae]|uniref:M96 mating-specific protein family n=1 Tax=Phytophthora kernoviae TaxID=325452 RepID=A0A3R7NM33_9STRA|nr:hypothetical protein BBI17_000955 [Phytophthora kernoviae]RLN85019.1 hypothetical protein BBO99_00000865 [Phytophthora kernoviae]
MAFLEDDDAMGAFEAALSFVDQYAIDTSVFVASPAPYVGSVPVEDLELLSLGLSPMSAHFGPTTVTTNAASSVAGSEASVSSPSSPVFQLSDTTPTRLELGLQDSGQGSGRHKFSGKSKKKTAGPKKSVTRGDPNRARNERKIELAYLREKVTQLELELHALKLHPRVQHAAIGQKQKRRGTPSDENIVEANSTVSLYAPEVPNVWKDVACRQRRRREKSERENVRLKLILENQIRMAKSLESLLQKRAKQQIVECSSLSPPKRSKYSQGRTLDFRADVNDFKELLTHLDRAYREVDTVFAANGLATMETTRRDARMREGADCMYLDIFANKVMPFGMRATAEAVWNHFKGAEKHRGNMYEGKVAKVLRRYVEKDREIVIWVASVVPLEFDDQRVKGLGFRHQGYAVTKHAAASTPEREFSLLQLCSLVSPEKEDHTVYDPAAVRALTDFMLGTVAGNISASQELIENVLMDQAVKTDSS